MRKSLLVVPAAVSLVLGVACGSNALVGNGGPCFVATDCQDGLVCVPNDPVNDPNGPRTCTNDVSKIAFPPPEAGADATLGDANRGDGTVPDTGPKPDTGTQPDTSAMPDTSVAPDTSTPPDSATD